MVTAALFIGKVAVVAVPNMAMAERTYLDFDSVVGLELVPLAFHNDFVCSYQNFLCNMSHTEV